MLLAACAAEPVEAPIAVERTMAQTELSFALAVAGHGREGIGAIAITDGVGTLALDGRVVTTVVYERQPWPDAGYTLFQGLAVERDRFYAVWFYCRGDELEGIYLHGTDGTPLSWLPARGTCVDELRSASTAVELPPLAIEVPSLVEGVDLDGPAVRYDGAQPGTLQLDGRALALAPFEVVDCRECPPNGWYELHSMLWDTAETRLGFGVLYLDAARAGEVWLAYGLMLPDLTALAPRVLEARWSVAGYGNGDRRSRTPRRR